MFVSRLYDASRTILVARPLPPATQRWIEQVFLYHSRAHPRPIPQFAVADAIDYLLEGIQQRTERRAKKWERNGVAELGKVHPDETIELAVNLNVDPRKPGQTLRGTVSLPHGTGKKNIGCVVFTSDPELQEAALKNGAKLAGGEALIDDIFDGKVSIEGLERSLATTDIMPLVSKKLARILGPRGLMPNPKVGTILPGSNEVLEALETQVAGKDVTYRTDKEGIIHVPVGKGSFGRAKLLENIGQVMKILVEAKPENYGKGRKSSKGTGKNTKYFLRAHVTSTQGKGYRVDLRTVDPGSMFFLSTVEQSVTKEDVQEVA